MHFFLTEGQVKKGAGNAALHWWPNNCIRLSWAFLFYFTDTSQTRNVGFSLCARCCYYAFAWL